MSIGERQLTTPKLPLLTAVALNGAAGTRTFTIDNSEGYSRLRLYSQFTHANTGTLTSAFTASYDSGTTLYTIMDDGATLGAGNAYVTASLSADADQTFSIDVRGMPYISCVVVHGGSPASGDLLTVTGYLVAE